MRRLAYPLSRPVVSWRISFQPLSEPGKQELKLPLLPCATDDPTLYLFLEPAHPIAGALAGRPSSQAQPNLSFGDPSVARRESLSGCAETFIASPVHP
uniref:Uncharacterized protein n=1 Tax=Trichuris muris TaxID=70415 RepID=A0A5S6QEU0_TRIMR